MQLLSHRELIERQKVRVTERQCEIVTITCGYYFFRFYWFYVVFIVWIIINILFIFVNSFCFFFFGKGRLCFFFGLCFGRGDSEYALKYRLEQEGVCVCVSGCKWWKTELEWDCHTLFLTASSRSLSRSVKSDRNICETQEVGLSALPQQ